MQVLYVLGAAKGMAFLHSKKIMHRDLKTANLVRSTPVVGRRPAAPLRHFVVPLRCGWPAADQRLVVESRCMSQPLSFAGKLRPPRLSTPVWLASC
jgi:serine/threonine protein kinase